MFLVSKSGNGTERLDYRGGSPTPMLALSGPAVLFSFASRMTSSTAAHTFSIFSTARV